MTRRESTLDELYPTRLDYLWDVALSIISLSLDRLLLPIDALWIAAEALASDIGT